jgi:oligopeptidase A
MTPPQAGAQTALLTHREVQTLFHEVGHLLHHVLSTVKERSLAGTRVLADFVELPSMITENFSWEKKGLDLFAKHVETGAPIPEDMLERMRAARTFRAANMLTRQLGFSTVDLRLHRELEKPTPETLQAFARDAFQPFSPAPLPSDYAMIASFSHLFGSPYGYAAGYYSYQWAEVLDADAFSRFAKAGVLSREVGMEFRTKILARGDEAPPEEIYRDFLGREPDVSALLARMGLSSAA